MFRFRTFKVEVGTKIKANYRVGTVTQTPKKDIICSSVGSNCKWSDGDDATMFSKSIFNVCHNFASAKNYITMSKRGADRQLTQLNVDDEDNVDVRLFYLE